MAECFEVVTSLDGSQKNFEGVTLMPALDTLTEYIPDPRKAFTIDLGLMVSSHASLNTCANASLVIYCPMWAILTECIALFQLVFKGPKNTTSNS